MKKLLAIFASLGILTNVSAAVVSCQPTNQAKPNDQPENHLNVEVLIEDENKNVLTTFNYETDFETLGELMSAPENEKTYDLEDFGGDLGHILLAITYEKDGQPIRKPSDSSHFWALWWVDNQGEENSSDVGMDQFVFAEKSEEIIWRFTKLEPMFW